MRFEKTIILTSREANAIRKLLTEEPKDTSECFNEDETIVYSAYFGDNILVDVKCCGVQFEEGKSNTAWTEAVLFENGSERCCTEVCDEYEGEWILEYNGNEYVVNVVVIDEAEDAIFLPGKIHGCPDQLYIIWLNPEACEGKGSWDIAPIDWETVLELYEEVNGNEDDFFAILPDRFHGRWCYCDADHEEFNGYARMYHQADFVVGRDGGPREEMEFIINWAKARKAEYER